jgi:hypothetical protein
MLGTLSFIITMPHAINSQELAFYTAKVIHYFTEIKFRTHLFLD